MTSRLLYVSTGGGWVSFDNLASLSVSEHGNLIVSRNGEDVAFFKSGAWLGYVWADTDDGTTQPSPVPGATKGGPRPIS